jgi:hypothetical protein
MISMRQQLLTARAAALFASDLSSASHASCVEVSTAIAGAVRSRGGTRGCVAAMAAAYGDCPETAVPRMRWALRTVQVAYDARRPEPERSLALAA